MLQALRPSLFTPARLAAATLVVALASGLTLSAHAQPPGPPPGGAPMMMMFGGPHFDRMLDAVNASADQRKQIQAIVSAARADLKAQHAAGASLHDQMVSVFTQPSVDAAAAENLRQQMLARQDQASKRMLQAMLDISAVLTVEQRQQIAAKMAERRAAMESRHSRAASAPAK